jgi:hemolysin-activating ACP:hemolysin acyltransferase
MVLAMSSTTYAKVAVCRMHAAAIPWMQTFNTRWVYAGEMDKSGDFVDWTEQKTQSTDAY